MTQFSISTSNDTLLARSHQKASNILTSNKSKSSLALSSKSFYGNSASNAKNQVTVPYMIFSKAVRNSTATSENPRESVGNSLTDSKESWKLKGDKRGHLPVSCSSPRKMAKLSSPRVNLLPECRAKRILTYSQTENEPVKSAPGQDFAVDDEANKENWDHANSVDIHKILQTLDRDMENETNSVGDDNVETNTNQETVSSTPVSKMKTVGLCTPSRQDMLPEDIGFPNPPGTNRCWMNATLQTLLGMEPFVEELERSCWKEERNGQSALLRSFFEVVRQRRRGRRPYLHSALRHLSRSLGALDAMFISDRQQDATEFLVRLLDLFREQFSSSKSDHNTEDRKLKDFCTLRELQLENLPTSSSLQRLQGGGQPDNDSHNPVCDNVEFRLKETYCCINCSECTTSCQDHLALFLDIPPTTSGLPSLQEALSRYMQPDVRELKCSKCSGQRCRVETAFDKLPRFLLVQVKRYAVQTAIAEKLTNSLRVPINLSVKNFVTDDVVMPAPWLPSNEQSMKDGDQMQIDEDDKEFQEAMEQSLDESKKEEDLEALELEKAIKLSLQDQQYANDFDSSFQNGDVDTSLGGLEEDDSPDYSYRLVCIIMHQGLSPNCGHYVADVYSLGQQRWYHYDDEVVSHPSEEEVVGSARQRNGYVFCYMHRRLFNQLTNQNAETSWNW
ncbi:ubiquitin carboxyl-terminal hydrolase 37-like isoform X2 [Periplaneta americana]|uniref:ubiquitin carboxyl-terminal hydrolase 37-like isoform X2 n=1 Tax=Periplaneta americana TaxID=6978 RepID=UPI0037E7DAB7